MPSYDLRCEILYNKFPQIAARLPQETADVVGAIVGHLVNIADPMTPIDTGNMKDSKVIDPGGIGRGGYVHWTAPYTGFVVYGTRYMPARPFIPAAIAQVQPIFIAAMAAMLKGL